MRRRRTVPNENDLLTKADELEKQAVCFSWQAQAHHRMRLITACS